MNTYTSPTAKNSNNIHLWLLTALIYWTDALPIGQLIVALFVTFHLLKNKSTLKNLPTFTRQLIAISTLSFAIGIAVNDLSYTLSAAASLLHLYFLVLFISLNEIDLNLCGKKLIRFCNIFLILNIISLFLIYSFGQLEWMILDDSRGSYRFRFVFSEPSYFAIFSSTLIHLILNTNANRRSKIFIVVLLLSLVHLSNSAAGLILSVVSIFFLAPSKPSKGTQVVYVLFALMSILAIGLSALSNEFIQMRLNDILIGRDNSFFLRFIAPWMVVDNVIASLPLSGSGFGFLNSYLLSHYSDYQFLAKFDAQNEYIENTNIDNAFAFIISSYGLPISFLIFYRLAYIIRANGGIRNVFFIFTLSLLTGSFIGPLLLGIINLKLKNK